MDPSDRRDPLTTVHYGYFVIQTRVTHAPAGPALTGVLEDLRTGEKRAFESGEALASLIGEWSAPHGVPPP